MSRQQATAELSTIQRRIRQQHPDGPVNDAVNLRSILDGEVREAKDGLYALLAATGCLLLVACLNIANLLVARAASRGRETAIRTALGGTRAQLIRTQVIESRCYRSLAERSAWSWPTAHCAGWYMSAPTCRGSMPSTSMA